EMTTSEEHILLETLGSLRKQRIEPSWEALNEPDGELYRELWQALHEVGLTLLALPEEAGGLVLDARSLCDVMCELGAASPALGSGLVCHLTAHALLREAADDAFVDLVDGLRPDASFAFVGSPLDSHCEPGFALTGDTHPRISGKRRVALPPVDWLVVPAL